MTADIDAATREQWLAKLIASEYPDAQGRYGPFGGRYVPVGFAERNVIFRGDLGQNRNRRIGGQNLAGHLLEADVLARL